MQADLSAVETGARLFFAVLIVLNLTIAAVVWRFVPLFRRRGVRTAHGVVLFVFNLPAVLMIGTDHHLPAVLPNKTWHSARLTV